MTEIRNAQNGGERRIKVVGIMGTPVRAQIGPVIQDVVKIDQTIFIYDTLRDNPGDLFGVVFDWA